MNYAMSYPIVTGDPITQGHADYCATNGHATHTSDGIDQEMCPRCGTSTAQTATATTQYATWANVTRELSVEQGVIAALDGYGDDYDIPAIVDAYRVAINAALAAAGRPERLSGDEFIGPYPMQDFRTTECRWIIESVDFWAIARAHDTTSAD